MIQADKTVPDCLKLGEWEFHVRSHELSRNGKTIRLEPRVASLLLYLAAHPGEPTSRTSSVTRFSTSDIVVPSGMIGPIRR